MTWSTNKIHECAANELLGIPIWFLYLSPLVKFLQLFNAAINFPIYYIMGTTFRDTFHVMFGARRAHPTQNGNLAEVQNVNRGN